MWIRILMNQVVLFVEWIDVDGRFFVGMDGTDCGDHRGNSVIGTVELNTLLLN